MSRDHRKRRGLFEILETMQSFFVCLFDGCQLRLYKRIKYKMLKKRLLLNMPFTVLGFLLFTESFTCKKSTSNFNLFTWVVYQTAKGFLNERSHAKKILIINLIALSSCLIWSHLPMLTLFYTGFLTLFSVCLPRSLMFCRNTEQNGHFWKMYRLVAGQHELLMLANFPAEITIFHKVVPKFKIMRNNMCLK